MVSLTDIFGRIGLGKTRHPEPVQEDMTGYGRLFEGSQLGIDGVDYYQPALKPHGLAGRQLDQWVESQNAAYANQFGNPFQGQDTMPIQPVVEDPLREWDITTRQRILASTHAAYARNPLARAMVDFTADFVTGDGFTLNCRNSTVRDILTRFIDNPDNAIREIERQCVIGLQVDGELVFRLFSEGADVVIVPMRPWELQYIKTEAGFFRRAESYRFVRTVTKGDDPTGQQVLTEDVPASQIRHVALNAMAYELRGRPELYAILPWLRADVAWLSDRSRQSQWRGGLMWHVRLTNATAAALSAAFNRWRKPPSPGSIAVTSEHEEIIPLVNSAQATDAANDGRALRLMNLIGMRMPEYMMSDGENANLATATRQELPVLVKFEAFQRMLIHQVWKPVFRKVLEAAIEAGLLTEMVAVEDAEGEQVMRDGKPVKDIRAVDAFTVEYDPVTGDKFVDRVNAFAVAEDRQWLDRDTIIEELGYDPQIIRDRLQVQHSQEREDEEAGLMPSMTPMDATMKQTVKQMNGVPNADDAEPEETATEPETD